MRASPKSHVPRRASCLRDKSCVTRRNNLDYNSQKKVLFSVLAYLCVVFSLSIILFFAALNALSVASHRTRQMNTLRYSFALRTLGRVETTMIA